MNFSEEIVLGVKGVTWPVAQFKVQQERDSEEEIHCSVPGMSLPFVFCAIMLLTCYFSYETAIEYNWDLS